MSASLLPFNTLGLNQLCDELIHVNTKETLINTCLELYHSDKAMMVLGGGSNVVFTEDFCGSVVIVETKGIVVEQQGTDILLTVEAGEDWHSLVTYCVENGYFGIENLALIPGTVGAAPIQNIGAYGVEFKDVCESVEFVDLDSSQLFEISHQDCQFGYRESIFKQQLKDRSVITAVKLRLSTNWLPNLGYSPLNSLNAATVSPQEVLEMVCNVRQSKLPDPKIIGNVGSFFKNPIISNQRFLVLKQQYPDIVGFTHDEQHTKLAAGWMIDNAGLKGFSIGGASIHEQQALVFTNTGEATGTEICQLAMHVTDKIEKRFGVTLEVEPRLIARFGEVTL
ncbi:MULTISPECIES: UDP-N-acetylmuramate dehydrogenase [Pseudomonadati]|uniref:UDP-N-acetylenolpyruvoylglucosamine reductase n=1 Tax=Shewanella aestuarii TaxID=1028752 RepID=A0ABT0L5E9_9GAMM|nr:UDP-N-acetylmuramate dehydrogenase [Shewanella aestuarii]MCL1118935.1 UDP-N-acetylmuramate dehydrogenase [Shewanella aestuarii]